MTPEPASDIFTVGDVAAYLKLPISTVYRLAERREIPGHKVGRQWRFQRAVIDEWLRKRSEARTVTILVADDDNNVREVLAEALEGPGRRVLQAKNGVEAVQWATAAPVDLVVLDLLMPEMDGVEAYRRIHAARPELPVVIVTGHTESDLMLKVLEIGPFTVLQKPLDINKFRKVIDLIVGA
ncbi:MAG: response regulator [Candidatus Rokubacteria bacterium]|nr:response regulator [Candidatus Rokubacteria bacterium]